MDTQEGLEVVGEDVECRRSQEGCAQGVDVELEELEL